MKPSLLFNLCWPLIIATSSLAQGPAGNALQLSGGNHAVAPAPSGAVETAGFVLEAWVNPSGSGTRTIASRGAGNSAASRTDWIVQITGTNQLSFFYNGAFLTSAANLVPDGQWTHIAVECFPRLATFEKQLWINGVPSGPFQAAATAPAALADIEMLYIGRQGSICNCNHFEGQLDELRLWTREAWRTLQPHPNTMRQSYPSGTTGLLANYRFNEAAGILALDSTAAVRHGIFNTTPTRPVSTAPFGGLAVGEIFVSQPATSEGGPSEATVTGFITTRGEPATYRWQHGPTEALGQETAEQSLAAGLPDFTPATQVFQNLPAGPYFARLRVSNAFQTITTATVRFTIAYFPALTFAPAVDLPGDVRLNGSVTPRGQDTTARFEWGRSPALGFSSSTSNIPAATTMAFVMPEQLLTTLQGGTWYFRLTATNATGATRSALRQINVPYLREAGPSRLAGFSAWGIHLPVDENGDGRMDVASVGSLNGALYVNTNNNGVLGPAQRRFETGTNFFQFGDAIDANHDGQPDLLIRELAGTSSRPGIMALDGRTPPLVLAGPGIAFPFPGAIVSWADVNGDGKPDACLGNMVCYQKSGSTFAPARVPPGLPVTGVDPATWQDFNQDGRLDCLQSVRSPENPTVRLFTQTPTGFTEDTVIAPVFDFTFSTGTRLAADFDGDGRLDFAFLAGGFAGTKVLQVWRNTPQGFEQVYRADFVNRFLTSGILLWGDLDHDGLPDLIAGGTGVTTWLRWDGSRMIADTSTFPVLTGTANVGAMLDIDGDHSLDLTLDGFQIESSTTISKLYLNRGLPANTVPTAPGNLRLTSDGPDTLLRWDPATDDLTPSPGLSGNVRIGTTPGGIDIVSPNSAADGFRRIVQLGNTGVNPFYRIRLTPGVRYYWSVQAIDASWQGGPFAAGQSFIAPGLSAFSQWAAAKNLTVANNSPTDDPDSDGLKNMLEFILDGNPLSSQENGLPPVLTKSSGTLTFTFPRSDDSEADFLLHAEISGDLQEWTPLLIGPDSTLNFTITENGSAPDTIQLTLPATLSPRAFARLSALAR
jgi:Concanavalin A-like lectin/glucanases superfamily/FG-GAP-like repeat